MATSAWCVLEGVNKISVTLRAKLLHLCWPRVLRAGRLSPVLELLLAG